MRKKEDFEQVLHDSVVIFDGAMGTEIYRRDVQTFRCFDELNLTDADIIRDIHIDYCNAGADVLTTNSFGANRISLGKFGIDDKIEEINVAAAKLAREVAEKCTAADENRRMFVAGSIGPVPPELEEDPQNVLREQAKALIKGGVNFIFFETQPTRDAMENCARAMVGLDFPFVLSCTVYNDLESGAGEPLSRLFSPLREDCAQPIAWSMNCGSGPDALLAAAEQVVKMIDRPLIVMPNAGMPREVGGRQLYLCSPDYIAGYAKRYLDLGVRGIGGCCGTTPRHIQEIAQRIRPLAKEKPRKFEVHVAADVTPQTPTPFPEKSRLSWRLAHREWVTTVEIVPPRGYNLEATIDKAKELHRRGVDAINIPDGPRASSRLSPLMTAAYIQREAMIEAILHVCSRDRNLIGMQADLLACALCDVRNLLFVTGDPPKLGNFPFASGVFDTDSIGMCGVQRRLNEGIDLGGQAIEPRTHAVIGVGADPTALDQIREIRRFRQKVEEGAEFAITQPVFDGEALLRFLDQVQDLGIPILAGIWPLASYRNAAFLQNEVPGVVIPEDVMERMAAAKGRDEQRQTGVDIAREAVGRIRDRIAGIQVSAPFGNIQTALAVME